MMGDNYDPFEVDWWFIHNQPLPRSTKTHYKNALYYCESCELVWERDCSGTIIRYGHLPTYGLKRIKCLYCESGENKTYKQRRKG